MDMSARDGTAWTQLLGQGNPTNLCDFFSGFDEGRKDSGNFACNASEVSISQTLLAGEVQISINPGFNFRYVRIKGEVRTPP